MLIYFSFSHPPYLRAQSHLSIPFLFSLTHLLLPFLALNSPPPFFALVFVRHLHSSSPAYLAPLVAQRAVLGNAVKVGLGDVNPRLEVLQKKRKANQGRREERREEGRE